MKMRLTHDPTAHDARLIRLPVVALNRRKLPAELTPLADSEEMLWVLVLPADSDYTVNITVNTRGSTAPEE